MNTITTTPNVTVKKSAAKNLYAANAQWANRPADERFDTLDAFLADALRRRKASMGAETEIRDLHAVAVADEVCLVGKAGTPAPLTNWSFGQLASTAGAPAAYLRTLPPKLAAECVETGLRVREAGDADARKLLLRKDADALRVHAITGNKYARIWNHEIASTVIALRDEQPSWQNPEAFRSASGRINWGDREILPCAFGGDRDCFVFLADYTKTVKVPGQDHPLARGFFLENSEVGAAAVKLTMFLFDGVCSNMIVWGTQDVTEVSMRHVGSVRDRFLPSRSKPMMALSAFANASSHEDEARIVNAQRMLVADTLDDARDVIVRKRIPGLTGGVVSAAYEIAVSEPRYGNPLSVWGMVNGITEYSQRTPYAGDRVDLDRAAGKLLTMKF